MRLVIFTLALGLAAAGTGCGAKDRTAQDLARYDFPIGSADVERGEAVFAEHCNGCHPGGEKGYGPKLIDHPEPLAEVRYTVREGKGRMPAFGEDEIASDDLEALLAYVDTLGAIAE